jgi:hypothetical protein
MPAAGYVRLNYIMPRCQAILWKVPGPGKASDRGGKEGLWIAEEEKGERVIYGQKGFI